MERCKINALFFSLHKSSAGIFEIADANDYYPFGLNHLKTGNSIFGQSSYKNYKFLGQELQKTGFYDLGARLYMPELGIFGQHDPLSSSTFDPYGYAYNNPIFFADPTGLEGEPINSTEPVIGTERSPIDVGEILLNAPLRAMSGSNLPTCSYCYTGAGVKGGLQNLGILPRPLSHDEALMSLSRLVLHNGSAK